MKTTILYFLLIFALFTSCSKKTYTALYDDNITLEAEDTKYYLPKNLLQLEIVYTVNEPRFKKGIVDKALKMRSSKITIADPIKVTKLSIPDTTNVFVIKGYQLADTCFVNMGANPKNVITEHVPSTSIDGREFNALDYSALTTSDLETEAYGAVLELQQNISKIETVKDVDLALKVVSLYKSQYTILNEDFQPYIKQYKLKYTVVIDPLLLYFKDGNWSSLEGNSVHHSIFPEHLLAEQGNLQDIITVKVTKPEVGQLQNLVNTEQVEGIVYRDTPPFNLEIAVNNTTLTKDTVALTQLGAFKSTSVKDIQSGETSGLMLFKENRSTAMGPLVPSFSEHIKSIDFDSAEISALSQRIIQKVYKEKSKNIDLLIESLKARKAAF